MNDMKLKLNHFFIPYLALLAFFFASVISVSGVVWYESLSAPLWNPRTEVIALIWAVIYACVAWSALIIWNMTHRDAWFHRTVAMFVFVTIINILWGISFFALHQLSSSVWFAFVLGIAVLVLIALCVQRSVKAAFLLLPYAAWIFFAAYLTQAVAFLNS